MRFVPASMHTGCTSLISRQSRKTPTGVVTLAFSLTTSHTQPLRQLTSEPRILETKLFPTPTPKS